MLFFRGFAPAMNHSLTAWSSYRQEGEIMIEKIVAELDDCPVSEVSLFRHTVFIDGPAVGLASTVNTGGCMQPVRDLGRLHKKTTRELAQLIFSDHLLERAVGMAAINSVVNRPSIMEKAGRQDAFNHIVDHGKGKNIAVLGHFPKVDWLRRSGMFENFWVFELQPQGEDLGADRYADLLPRADFVLITATTLINGTFPEVMSHCRDSFKVVLGPSTPLHPLLFDYGVDCIAGSVVTDKNLARTYLSQGAAYRQTEGLERLTWFRSTA